MLFCLSCNIPLHQVDVFALTDATDFHGKKSVFFCVIREKNKKLTDVTDFHRKNLCESLLTRQAGV